MKSKWMLVTFNLTTVLSVDSTSMTISHHCHRINIFEISTCVSHIMQHPQSEIFLRKLAKHSGNLIEMLTYKDTNKTSLLSLPSHLCICPSAMLFPEPVTECWLSAAGPSSCSALSLLTQFTLSAQCPAPALLWSQDTGHKRGTRGGLTTHITRDIYHHINKTEAMQL